MYNGRDVVTKKKKQKVEYYRHIINMHMCDIAYTSRHIYNASNNYEIVIRIFSCAKSSQDENYERKFMQ